MRRGGNRHGPRCLTLFPNIEKEYQLAIMRMSRRLFSVLRVSDSQFPTTRSPELVRAFIHDCLYNPEEGYFNRREYILNNEPTLKIPFNDLKHERDYNRYLRSLYSNVKPESNGVESYHWHTPSSLFRPWYGRAMAKKIMEYWAGMRPRSLKIYELGPGTGTMALDILDYLRGYEDVYRHVEYHLVEASGLLHQRQKDIASRSAYKNKIICHHASILDDWNFVQEDPCVVLGMELLDNLPQDKLAFMPSGGESPTLVPLQGMVLTNNKARFSTSQPVFVEAYEPVQDQWIQNTLNILHQIGYEHPSLKYQLQSMMQPRRSFFGFMSKFLPEMRDPLASEFIPTMIVKLLHVVKRCFPKHLLILSDFSYLPDTIPGHTGSPVVQTHAYKNTVPCSTYLLKRGLFDIFFPVSFPLLEKLYSHIMNSRGNSISFTHASFMHQYAELEKTTLRSGHNPLLEEFQNVHVFCGTSQ